MLKIVDQENNQPFLYSKVTQKSLEVLEVAKAISIDLETTALSYRDGQIRLIQVYLPKINTVIYVDLFLKNLVTKNDQQVELDTKFVGLLLRKIADKSVIKVYHNALFDIGWIWHHYQVMSVNNFDTMIASQIIKAGQFFGYQKAFRATPNSLAFLILEFDFNHDKDVDHKIWKQIEDLPAESIKYAVRDAYYTFIIGKSYKEYLSSVCPLVLAAEMSVIPAFVFMNWVGLPVNYSYLQEVLNRYEKKTLEIENELCNKIQITKKGSQIWFDNYYSGDRSLPKKYSNPSTYDQELADTEFKPGSSQSVGRWLCDFVPVESLLKKDNKTGKTSIRTDKATLFLLGTIFDRPELRLLTQYRSIKGATSKFRSYLASYIPERGSIATSYTILARQGSGRSSSGKKKSKEESIKYHNGQNFSKHLPSHYENKLPATRSIVQPRSGYVLAEFDAAASHLQIARYLSQDPSLIESNNLGIKVHYYTLSSILAQSDKMTVTPEEARELIEGKNIKNQGHYKTLYKFSKTVIYSFLNYSGAATLQNQFFNQEVQISLRDCEMFLEACANRFSVLRDFQNSTFKRVQNTLRPYYVKDKYIGHFAKNDNHLDGAITYHQAKIKQSAFDRFVESIGDSTDGDELLEYDATGDYSFIQSLKKSNGDLYLKISDVIAALWLRPEATMMKFALGLIFDYQLESGYDFRLLNYSHDSYLLEINKNCIESVAQYAFDSLNQQYQKLITDYKPEGCWQDCLLGDYWEKPGI